MSLFQKARDKYFLELERDVRFRIRQRMKPAVVNLGDVKVCPNSPLISQKVKRTLYRGNYERSEMALVRNHLSTSDRVLELGAGLGVIGSLCALRVGSDRVASVEANPQLESLIRETHRLNGVSPELLIAMVDHEDGEGAFFVDSNLHSSSAQRRAESAVAISVPKISIGSLLVRYRPTFLVVDVEGHEQTLFGAAELPGVHKICIELHPHIIGDAACGRVIASFQQQGFVMRIDDIGERNFFFERKTG